MLVFISNYNREWLLSCFYGSAGLYLKHKHVVIIVNLKVKYCKQLIFAIYHDGCVQTSVYKYMCCLPK